MATPPAPWPGAQSERSAWLLAPAPRPALVLAAFPAALYLHLDGTVLPVVARTGLRLPTALLVTAPLPAQGWGVRAGDTVPVGGGRVRLPGATIEVRRTWRPARMPCAGTTAPVSLAGPGDRWQDAAGDLADAAVADRDVAPLVAALVGAGQGLTPSGDDVLCGLMLGLRLVGEGDAVGHLWSAVAARLATTTSLSASLLREAADGYAIPQLVRLGAALAAGDEPATTAAVDAVLAVGHTSGSDLLAGFCGALDVAGAPHRRELVSTGSREGAAR